MSKTHNVIVLDESGSMMKMAQEAVDGYNSIVKALKKSRVDGTLSTVAVSTTATAKSMGLHVSKVTEMARDDYNPTGFTALYDGIGIAISQLKQIKGDGDRVLVSIITDGRENNSKEWDSESVGDAIRDLRRNGWEFTFMGASEKAAMAAMSIGIPRGNIATYDSLSVGATRTAFASMSNAISSYTASTDLTNESLYKKGKES